MSPKYADLTLAFSDAETGEVSSVLFTVDLIHNTLCLEYENQVLVGEGAVAGKLISFLLGNLRLKDPVLAQMGRTLNCLSGSSEWSRRISQLLAEFPLPEPPKITWRDRLDSLRVGLGKRLLGMDR